MPSSRPTYPYVEQISDIPTKLAIRYLWDSFIGVSDTINYQISGSITNREVPKTYGPSDVGKLFRSTDFDRVYRWTGTQWEDAPGQPARKSVSFFTLDTTPGTGWSKCNGSRVSISTNRAETEQYQVPSIPITNGVLVAWIRL